MVGRVNAVCLMDRTPMTNDAEEPGLVQGDADDAAPEGGSRRTRPAGRRSRIRRSVGTRDRPGRDGGRWHGGPTLHEDGTAKRQASRLLPLLCR